MADRSKYQRARVGDVAYNTMRMWQGAVGVVPADGLISPAYVVVRPYPDVDPRYYAYLFRTAAYLQQIEIESRGIVPDRNRLYWDAFKAMPAVYPPIDEQRAIADYLDIQGHMVRRLAYAKRAVRQLLERQLAAEYQQALTRGIGHVGERRNAGAPWLPDVPVHWRVDKLKRFIRLNPSRAESAALRHDAQEVVFLPMERVSTEGRVDCSERRPIRDVWEGYTYFRRGDVVMAKITPCFENGKGAVLGDLATEIGFGTTEFIVMRPGEELLPEYLDALCRMPVFRQLGGEAMTGAAGQQRVPASFVRDFVVAVPPIDEQRAILEHLTARRDVARRVEDRIAAELHLVQEHHEVLIAAAVTGEIDVRGVAFTQSGAPTGDLGEDAPGDDDDLLAESDDDLELDAVTSDAD